MIDQDARIYVAGHRGMVGSALVRKLQAKGYSRLLTRTHQQLDLLDQKVVFDFLAAEKPDYIFVAAARVGGIQANSIYRGQFIYENLAIAANLIHGAHRAGVDRLCFLGSSCIYPRDCPQPIREECLLTGPLEPTNEPYAIAKIAGIKLCESYNRQYGRKYVSAMPTNLYGPHDNYDLETSHVLPALIRKAHLARLASVGDRAAIDADEARYGAIPDHLKAQLMAATPTLTLWGTGTPRREFLYVDDLADACVFLMENGIGEGFYNVGSGSDVTIRELAETIMDVVGFRGEIVFDAGKPDGTMRKLLDVSRLSALGWRSVVPLRTGVAAAYDGFLSRPR